MMTDKSSFRSDPLVPERMEPMELEGLSYCCRPHLCAFEISVSKAVFVIPHLQEAFSSYRDLTICPRLSGKSSGTRSRQAYRRCVHYAVYLHCQPASHRHECRIGLVIDVYEIKAKLTGACNSPLRVLHPRRT